MKATLEPVAQEDWAFFDPLALHRGSTIQLGRSAALGIPADETTVSRAHCELHYNTGCQSELLPRHAVWIRPSETGIPTRHAKGTLVKARVLPKRVFQWIYTAQ